MVEGLGFRGLGFRVEGLGFRVQGLGFRQVPVLVLGGLKGLWMYVFEDRGSACCQGEETGATTLLVSGISGAHSLCMCCVYILSPSFEVNLLFFGRRLLP